MSLAEELAAAIVPPKPKFDSWVEDLDPVDRKALLNAAASGMPSKTLSRIIRNHGGAISDDKLKDWRRSHGWVG